MKKILVIIAVSMVMSAGSSFAAAPSWTAASSDGSITIAATSVGASVQYSGKLSANVKYAYGANSDGTAYTLGTHHTSGSKSYATASSESRIFMQENAAQSSAAAPPEYASPIVWTGWTSVK